MKIFHGPYETETAVIAELRRREQSRESAPNGAFTIRAACEARGIELGAYDERIITWLGGMSAQTSEVVADLIRRAYAAGRRDERADTALAGGES